MTTDKNRIILNTIRRREKLVKLINFELSKKQEASVHLAGYLALYKELGTEINRLKGKI